MSTTIKALVAVGLLTIVAACSQQEEEIIVDEPVFEEPVSNKF